LITLASEKACGSGGTGWRFDAVLARSFSGYFTTHGVQGGASSRGVKD